MHTTFSTALWRGAVRVLAKRSGCFDAAETALCFASFLLSTTIVNIAVAAVVEGTTERGLAGGFALASLFLTLVVACKGALPRTVVCAAAAVVSLNVALLDVALAGGYFLRVWPYFLSCGDILTAVRAPQGCVYGVAAIAAVTLAFTTSEFTARWGLYDGIPGLRGAEDRRSMTACADPPCAGEFRVHEVGTLVLCVAMAANGVLARGARGVRASVQCGEYLRGVLLELAADVSALALNVAADRLAQHADAMPGDLVAAYGAMIVELDDFRTCVPQAMLPSRYYGPPPDKEWVAELAAGSGSGIVGATPADVSLFSRETVPTGGVRVVPDLAGHGLGGERERETLALAREASERSTDHDLVDDDHDTCSWSTFTSIVASSHTDSRHNTPRLPVANGNTPISLVSCTTPQMVVETTPPVPSNFMKTMDVTLVSFTLMMPRQVTMKTDPAELTCLSELFLAAVLRNAPANRGVVETTLANRVLVSFNASRKTLVHCGMAVGAIKACHIDLVGGRFTDDLNGYVNAFPPAPPAGPQSPRHSITFSAAAAAGPATVGLIGALQFRRAVLLGRLVERVAQLDRVAMVCGPRWVCNARVYEKVRLEHQLRVVLHRVYVEDWDVIMGHAQRRQELVSESLSDEPGVPSPPARSPRGTGLGTVGGVGPSSGGVMKFDGIGVGDASPQTQLDVFSHGRRSAACMSGGAGGGLKSPPDVRVAAAPPPRRHPQTAPSGILTCDDFLCNGSDPSICDTFGNMSILSPHGTQSVVTATGAPGSDGTPAVDIDQLIGRSAKHSAPQHLRSTALYEIMMTHHPPTLTTPPGNAEWMYELRAQDTDRYAAYNAAGREYFTKSLDDAMRYLDSHSGDGDPGTAKAFYTAAMQARTVNFNSAFGVEARAGGPSTATAMH